ncbi:transcription factor S [Candidatus Woesearchaeota archaeon]|nr:transcription factor S [Candidatus Woesearchaeota archaeon]
MKFCPKCKSLMMPKKKKNQVVLECTSCGLVDDKSSDIQMKETKKETAKIEIIDPKKTDENLPTTEADCDKCGNDKAFYWLVQTRAADESQTKFLRCTKCGHTWRDYS